MKHKLSFKRNRASGYLAIGLPSIQWMEDNIGKHLVDWRCYVEKPNKIVVTFKDEDKKVLFILLCGDIN